MNLGGYVLRRLLQLVPIALGVTILVFFLIHLVPGDPAATILGNQATPARVALLHHQWGLDRPHLGPVREVHGPGRARQPRRLALLRRLRRPPRAAAAAGDALADRLRDAAVRADRGAVGGDRRDAIATASPTTSCVRCRWSASASRPSGWGSCCCSSSGCTSGGVPGRRLRQRVRRPSALDVPAGADGRVRDRADPDPQPAREPARGARVGLRDHRALEGPAGVARARPPRAPQRGRSRPSPCSASTSATSSAARS